MIPFYSQVIKAHSTSEVIETLSHLPEATQPVSDGIGVGTPRSDCRAWERETEAGTDSHTSTLGESGNPEFSDSCAGGGPSQQADRSVMSSPFCQRCGGQLGGMGQGQGGLLEQGERGPWAVELPLRPSSSYNTSLSPPTTLHTPLSSLPAL